MRLTQADMTSYVKTIVLAILVGLIFVSLLSDSTYNIGPFMIEMKLSLIDHGLTTISIPPVGDISAQTHLPPVKLKLVLESMDFDQLSEIVINDINEQELFEEFRNELSNIIRSFSVKILSLAAVGGFVGSLIGSDRQPKKILIGVLVSTLVAAGILLITFGTFDLDAFENPEFDGTLEAFPWMVNVVEDSLATIDSVGEQLQVLSENIFLFFQRVEDLEGMDIISGDYKVLHVSDIHNNPASYDLVVQIIDSFDIDMIIDSGDITDYGTPIEAELSSRISQLPVEYVFVAGNHDSPQVVERVNQIDNVTVISRGVEQVFNFNIAGIEDPASTSTAMQVPEERILLNYADRLKEEIDNSEDHPDIVVAHHPRIAEEFKEEVPLVLTGHTHQPNIEQEQSTLLVNAGTTGAAGIRGLEEGGEVPYSLAVLHFNDQKAPIAVDMIKVRHLEAGYQIERVVVQEHLR